MSTLKDNPQYHVVFHSEVHNLDIYAPVNIADYHLQRKVAASAQDIFSNAGATKETLQAIVGKMLEACNNEYNKDTLRTDIAAYCNNILYRLRYPVDEHCAIRMGAILTFLETEDPNRVQDFYTQKKMRLALGSDTTPPDPDLYAFFLTMGAASTPSYQNLLHLFSDPQYMETRQQNLLSMTSQKA